MPAWLFVSYCLIVKIGTLGERPLLAAQSGHPAKYGRLVSADIVAKSFWSSVKNSQANEKIHEFDENR